MSVILHELLPDWRVLSLADFPEFDEPEETGETYAENAIIKAEAARDSLSPLPLGEDRPGAAVDGGEGDLYFVADDAGLEIDAMGGAPGVKSKRFAGEHSPFSEKISLILSHLQGRPTGERTARFHCAVAIAKPDRTVVFEAAKEGVICETPRGDRGFGYDPIFYLPELEKTYAELDPAHKNVISHRGIVLREAAAWLSSL